MAKNCAINTFGVPTKCIFSTAQSDVGIVSRQGRHIGHCGGGQAGTAINYGVRQLLLHMPHSSFFSFPVSAPHSIAFPPKTTGSSGRYQIICAVSNGFGPPKAAALLVWIDGRFNSSSLSRLKPIGEKLPPNTHKFIKAHSRELLQCKLAHQTHKS